MCTNLKKIYNKYTGVSLYVECGKCEACLQEKAAHRATRIRNNNMSGYVCLFITLTYDRMSCPVVYRADLAKRLADVPVYRLVQSRNVRVDADYTIKRKRKYEPLKLDTLHDVTYPSDFNADTLPSLSKLSKKFVGICYYEDIKNFYKRLREYVQNHYKSGVPPRYSNYNCSEYGETTYRPHFHTLLFVPKEDVSFFKRAILACWPYADYRRTASYIEIARDAASYVASYVNSGADFPPLFQTRAFRQKHSYSRSFGVHLECFQLDKILAQVERGTLYYNSTTTKDGTLQVVSCLIPRYVINRYFPKFKGISRRTGDSWYRFMQRPSNVTFEYVDNNSMLKLNDEEVNSISTRLRNAYTYYHRVTKRTYEDFLIDYQRVWNLYFSCQMRKFYEESAKNNYVDAYDNIADYVLGGVRSPNLDDYGIQVPNLNPNEFTYHKHRTDILRQTYALKKKTRKVVNYSMAAQGHYV